MNREDIISMARQAGMEQDGDNFFSPLHEEMDVHITDLERFAALVAAAQREASAKLCASLAVDRGFFHPDDDEFKRGVLAGASMCAATIRLRKD